MSATRDSHRYFLIRHGETDWNREFRYQGTSDIALNDDGVEQARRAAVRLAAIVPTRVFTSPLARAARTAEIIMAHGKSDAKAEPLDELREISFGSWEGLTVAEIREHDAETLKKWRLAPFSCTPKGGETFGEIMGRARGLAKSLAEGAAPGGATFIVSHGGVLRALIAAMLRFDDIDLLWRMRFDNCSISVIDTWGSRPFLLLTNDTHHLRAEDDERIASLVFPL